jgi:DNA-cytosine methyltransferase
MKKLKLLDTFSGIGGFSYAAEKLVGGFETTQFIEIDPYCQKVLNKHWPNVPIHNDITTFTARPFQFDAVCGGFPCQDLSVAGKRAGITKESRSGLFYELMRVIRMVRPKYVILENVAAILNNGLDIVLGELSEAGYDAEWAVISASSLGACHRRSRWWLVAYPNNDGSSSSEKSRSIEKTDGRSEKRKNETCQSQRSSESKYTETFQFNATHSNSDGYQGQCFETRNKVASRQDTSSKWSTNTSELERQSDDGRNKTESRTDENLSGSSDGGKAISTITGKICDLSKGTNNDQRTSSQDNYQKNNDRTLVSERQSRVQLSQHRELGRDQTTLENNSIRQGDDNSENKRMDKQKSNVTNSHSNRLQGEVGSRTYRTIWRTQNIRRLNPNWRQYDFKPVFRRGDDGLSDRTHRLKALGNSVVVQCAAIPLQRVLDLENE